MFAINAGAAIVTFESPETTYALLQSNGSSKIAPGISGGLSGSLGATVDSAFSNETLVGRNGFAPGASNPTFNTSVYFQFSTPTSDAGSTFISIGIAGEVSHDAFSGSPIPKQSVFGIRKSAFSNTYSIQYSSFGSGGGIGSGGTLSSPLVNGTWYRLSMAGIWDSSRSNYDLNCTINASDSAGNIGQQLNQTRFDDLLLIADYPEGVHSFMALSGPAGSMGITRLDNFAVTVPEPATGLLALVAYLAITTTQRPSRPARRFPERA